MTKIFTSMLENYIPFYKDQTTSFATDLYYEKTSIYTLEIFPCSLHHFIKLG